MELISWPGGSWEASLRMVIAVVAIYLAAIWVTLIFWTYRDIRQRTRDPILQTVAVLLVLFFFLPGHWIYLILRPRYTLAEAYERSLEEEALLQELEDQKSCPACKRRVYDDYLICPSCRTQLKEPCRQCSKPLSYAWVACPFCGLEKPPREPIGPRQVRTPGRGPTPPSPGSVRRSSPPAGPRPAREYATQTAQVIGPTQYPAGGPRPATPPPVTTTTQDGASRPPRSDTVSRPPRPTDPFATPRHVEATPRTEDGTVIDATPRESGTEPG